MVFKDLPTIRVGQLMLNFGAHEGPANLIPFKTIIPYLLGQGGLIIGGLNIGGNIIFINSNWFSISICISTNELEKKL
jgi:hypothetical protein